jgi:thiol-disulfide isomerase/thioredoxin
MKNRLLIFLIMGISNINHAQRSHLTLEARIENRNGDTVQIVAYDNISKVIKSIGVNSQGYFKDTLRISEGLYGFFDKVEITPVYLKNGYDLRMKLNAKKFDETMNYEGIGAEENNFLAGRVLADQKYDAEAALIKDETDFKAHLDRRRSESLESLRAGGFSSQFVANVEERFQNQWASIEVKFKKRLSISKLTNTISPSFAYENANGDTTRLESLRGKYVFIDVWATWCAPCIAELPALQKIEERYADKNIAFVGLSIDEKRSHTKWKRFIIEKSPGGIQVIADNAWRSSFTKAYGIDSIPRFILIDPDGRVVNADAPRPSSPKLMEELDRVLSK